MTGPDLGGSTEGDTDASAVARARLVNEARRPTSPREQDRKGSSAPRGRASSPVRTYLQLHSRAFLSPPSFPQENMDLLFFANFFCLSFGPFLLSCSVNFCFVLNDSVGRKSRGAPGL